MTEAFKSADGKVESAYHIPYIAHTPLETRAAIAEWNDDNLPSGPAASGPLVCATKSRRHLV